MNRGLAAFALLAAFGCRDQPSARSVAPPAGDSSPRPAAAASPAAPDTLADSTTRAVASALEELLWNQSAPRGVIATHWALMQHLYDRRHYRPLWTSGTGSSAHGRALLDSLCRPGREGLGAAVHDSAGPSRRGDAAARAARRDLNLTGALLRHLDALAHGEVAPAQVSRTWRIAPPEALGDSALAAAVRLVVRAGLPAAEVGLRPSSAAYDPLAARLATLLDADTAAQSPELPDSVTLRPGLRDPAVAALRRRLTATGDLSDARATGTLYDAAVTRAVRRFQTRHGLAADGAVGPATRAALAESPRSRALTVMTNLERYRWLPSRPDAGTLIADLGDGSLTFYPAGADVVRLALQVSEPCRMPLPPVLADSVATITGDSLRLVIRLRGGDSLALAAPAAARRASTCLVVPELGRLAPALLSRGGAAAARVTYVVWPTVVADPDSLLVFRADSTGSDTRLRAALAALGDTSAVSGCPHTVEAPATE
jgi:murein L,D-transpeptidase YcbB/YkuD